LLSPLGLTRRRLREGGRLRWAYVLDAEQLVDLQARYGTSGGEPQAVEEASPRRDVESVSA
jgi:hypothetical protein